MKKLIILLALLSLTPACAYYSGGPWRGRVLDMETREPIEGAAVVAVWEYAHPSIPEARVEFFEAKETVSGKDGYFEFEKYTQITFISNEIWEPSFLIFKPGYAAFPGLASMEGKWVRVEKGNCPLFLLKKLTQKEERLKNIIAVGSPRIPTEKIKIYNSLEKQELTELSRKEN